MRLIVDGFGKFIGVEGGLIAVKERGKVLGKYKPDELSQVVVSGKGAISSDAIRLLLQNRVDLVFLDGFGNVMGRLTHPLVGTARTRREQYAAYEDERGVYLAKEFLKAKMLNQSVILANLAKTRKDRNPDIAEFLLSARREVLKCVERVEDVTAAKIDEVRERLLGIESVASKRYWDGIARVLPPQFNFSGRRGVEPGSPRYARDVVNAMLNYGYSILLSECTRALELAGLDPYAGFLHVDVSGRTSLAVDFMENFRQQVVDRVVLRLISYGQVKPEDGEMRNFVCSLRGEARRLLLSSILERLDSRTQYAGRNLTYSSIILHQARKLVAFLRGEGRYRAFVQRW